MSVNNSVILSGSIHEGGFIKGFNRKGFTDHKLVNEEHANGLDAGATSITYKIKGSKICIIDNGLGMNEEDAKNMTAVHRENHAVAPKRGVSGLGSKPAGKMLSEDTYNTYYTRKENGPYLAIEYNWAKMLSEEKYTGNVIIRSLTETEKEEFDLEHPEGHGTTIEFPNTTRLRRTIEDNFRPINKLSISQDPLDRIGIVYGADPVRVSMQKETDSEVILPTYDYFGADDYEYYGGKQIDRIEQWNHKNPKVNDVRYILYPSDGSTPLEVHKAGAGYSKEPEPMKENLLEYVFAGPFTNVCGLRKDALIYDESNPKPFATVDVIGEYNKKYLGDDSTTSRLFRGSNKLRRNLQIIGVFKTPEYTLSSARGNPLSNLSMLQLQNELCFNPVSKQDHPQDIACGIQENKNQFNGDAMPKNLTRLVKYCREKKAKAIWLSFPAEVRGEVHEMNSAASTETTTPASESTTPPSVTPPPEFESPGQSILDVFAQVEQPVVQPVLAQVLDQVAAQVADQAAAQVVEHIEEVIEHVETVKDSSPRVAVDVQGYRRGTVTGSELKIRWEQYLQRYHIADGTEYTGKHVELFNLIGDLLRE